MEKILFCNLDLLRKKIDEVINPSLPQMCAQFLNYANNLCCDRENRIFFMSRDSDLLNSAKEHFIEKHGYSNFNFQSRDKVRDFVMKHRHHNNLFVFISGKEVDFHLAVNTKSLFIVPTWIPTEEKSKLYGVHVDTPEQLFKFIRTLNNQKSWYAETEIEPNVTVLSLMDGRYKYKAKTENERDMIEHFEQLFKLGSSRNYYDILLYHFLAGMTNSKLFDDIELFGMIPSSDCSLNPDIFSFMHQIRIIKGKHIPRSSSNGENILLRTSPKQKAHLSYSANQRIDMGASDEFKTICINPDFKNKISSLKKSGKFNVCIFDDYMTHGNSFNAVRNLLQHLGANKIIFVSLGNFGKPFQKKDYILTGDVYTTGYTFDLINSSTKYLTYNDTAKAEVSELYDIFNS